MVRIVVAGAAMLALVVGALRIPSWGGEFTRFLPWYGGMVLVWAAAAWTVLRSRGPARPALVAAIWGVAVAVRVPLVLAEPTLSDDLYRYLWDGRVLLEGINPYRYAPDAEALAALRDALWPRINHPDLPTIYPPLLQLVFAGIAAIAPTVSGLKAAMAGFDLLAGFLLMETLRRLGRSPAEALLYLWCPLPLIEFAGQGHADAIGVALVSAALLAHARHRPLGSGLALTLAGLVKFLPWAALPLLVRRLRFRWLLLPALALAFYLPFQWGGVDAFGSLTTYAAKWRSNDLLFGLWLEETIPSETGLEAAKRISVAITAAVWILVVALRRPWPEVYAWTLGAVFLVSPVVHPWYLTWLLPVALVLRHPAWWVWAATGVLAYTPLPGFLETGVWAESTAVKLAEYVPVFAAIAGQLAWSLTASRRGAA